MKTSSLRFFLGCIILMFLAFTFWFSILTANTIQKNTKIQSEINQMHARIDSLQGNMIYILDQKIKILEEVKKDK